MKTALKTLALIATLTLAACSGSQTPYSTPVAHQDGIIGGTEVQPLSDINQSVVGIVNVTRGAICTGSLLENNVVLTAAHCIDDKSQYYIVFHTSIDKVFESEDREFMLKVLRPVIATEKHANWKDESSDSANDIGLMKFLGSIPEGYKPATFLADGKDLTAKTSVVLAGYGASKAEVKVVDPKTHPDLEKAIANGEVMCSEKRDFCASFKTTGSGILRTVDVPVLSTGLKEVSLDQTSGKGACSGDSGGPAYLKKDGQLYLWGITSRGMMGCAHDTVYTNALGYMDWMKEATFRLEAKAWEFIQRMKEEIERQQGQQGGN